MARLKSIRLSAQTFQKELAKIRTYVESAKFSEAHETYWSWIHEHAVIRTYRGFENLMLDALVGTINNNTSVLKDTLGFTSFPTHLTKQVCEYIVTGGGYFDFKGRSGLLEKLQQFVPKNHYLVKVVKKKKYEVALERLSAFRNYSAHGSDQAKRAALKVAGLQRMGSAGSFLKTQNRFGEMIDSLTDLAAEIEAAAPF